MTQLNSLASIKSLPVTLERVRDLIYFEGPLLVELRAAGSGEPYLASWCEKLPTGHRWMYFRVDRFKLEMMKLRKLSMREVIPGASSDGFVYFVDIGSNEALECHIVACANIPEKYCPKASCLIPEDSIFDNVGELSVPISGVWEPSLFAKFQKQIMAAFSLDYAVRIMGVESFKSFNWRQLGGFSPSHLFDWLLPLIPGSDRLSLRELQYRSPGIIRFKAHESTKQRFLSVLEHYENNRSAIRERDKELKDFLREHKTVLEREQKTDLESGSPDEQEQEVMRIQLALDELARQLWKSMSLDDLGELVRRKLQDSYEFAHVTKWYVERFEIVSGFVRKGMAYLPPAS